MVNVIRTRQLRDFKGAKGKHASKNSFINLKYQFEQLALLLQSLYTSINMAEFLSSN